MLRLEDLCALAPAAVDALARLVGGSRDAAMLALEAVIDPRSCRLGKWRALAPDELRAIQDAALDGLRAFGYALEA